MRANSLPGPVQGPQIVFFNAACAHAHLRRERLGMRACLAAWSGLAIASWAAVFVIGSRFF